VPIPPHEPVGTLPPFVGEPAGPIGRAPYPALPEELVDHFGYTSRRREILKGLFAHRDILRRAGISIGFQWIDGSFVDRAVTDPNDVDVVTFYVVPAGYTATSFRSHLEANFPDALPPQAKTTFRVDSFFVALDLEPMRLVARTSYWFGLFSHQRGSMRWRGFVQTVLHVDDADALKKLGP
jgi:hypothetical protein